MSYGNPYLTNPYMQPAMPVMQPQAQQMPAMQQPQQQAGTLVDGSGEAMNRFLMRYPANMLVPGFVSDPLFDVNGRQFYTLSIEDGGYRNLETFDFTKHVDKKTGDIDVSNFITRAEFQGLVDKIDRMTNGVGNGIHEQVQVEAARQPTASQLFGSNEHGSPIRGQ